jgi:YYY domain-containing protein
MEFGLVVVWAAAYLALALAALPLCGALFPRFPDRGAAFTFPASLAVLGIVGYLVGHLAFGWPALAAGLVVLVVGSYLVAERADAELDYRAFAESGVVFLLAFGLLVAVRAVDPAVHPLGGEKFLDYGLLRSLLRAPVLPPEDMWFAGEPVQYYYGGHLISALLADLTFTTPRYAYNLALAGFYASVVTAAYGLAGAVADMHGSPRRLAAGLGAFFVALAGNLYTFGQTLVWALPDGVARTVAGIAGLPQSALAWRPQEFSYWSASRVMSAEPGNPDAFSLITEFPLFAWLNGDLHAHMTSTGFLLLVGAICLAYWRTPAEDLLRRRVLVFGAIPPIAGLVAVVNTWSFPTILGVTWLTLAFAPATPLSLLPPRFADLVPEPTRADGGGEQTEGLRASSGERSESDAGEPSDGTRAQTDGGVALTGRELLHEELTRTGGALVLAVGLVVLGVVWSLPFWLGTASGRSVGLVPAVNRSALGGLLLVHGGFLLAFVPYVARRGLSRLAQPYLTLLTVVLFSVAAWSFGLAGVALFAPLLVAGWYVLRTRTDAGFETLLMVGGLGIVLLVEFLYVVEEAGPGRMNTVFKTYAQVWMLWSVAAGVMLARLTAVGRDSLPAVAGSDRSWRVAGTVLAVLLVFSTGLYAGFALPQHFERGSATANEVGPTLDAVTFVGIQHPREAPAIDYVDSLEGTPTIVTAAPAGYRWDPSTGKGASAPSSLTGVPTVAGWYHERGYRGGEVYSARVDDVETIYTGSAAAQTELLAEYDVQYVYVGPAERNRYGSLTITDHPALSVAESFESVTIYRVDRGTLDG